MTRSGPSRRRWRHRRVGAGQTRARHASPLHDPSAGEKVGGEYRKTSFPARPGVSAPTVPSLPGLPEALFCRYPRPNPSQSGKARSDGYMLGQLWVVDDPEPVDGFDDAAGVGDAALVAASAGPARAIAAPARTPITGSAARSQSFRLSR